MHLLVSPWMMWLAIIGIQTYTSGIAWMINHIGPGSLIAGIWFLAGLARAWEDVARWLRTSTLQYTWLRNGMLLAVILLTFSGLGVVRIPLPALPQDADRYLSEIEAEFQGDSADDILLDVGTWVYLDEEIIMKDRAATIGERGYSNTADFSGILERIGGRQYSKILVRNYHSPDFWYDHFLWEHSSGIRQALLANYTEIGRIQGVEGVEGNYLFSEVSILVPNLP